MQALLEDNEFFSGFSDPEHIMSLILSMPAQQPGDYALATPSTSREEPRAPRESHSKAAAPPLKKHKGATDSRAAGIHIAESLMQTLPSEIQEMPDTLPKLSEACNLPSVTFALAPSDALEGATLEHATQSIAKHAEGGQRFFKLVLPTTSRSDGNITSATASADMSSRTCWFCTLQATQECQE